MNSVTDYLRIFNDEEHKPLIEDYKKEMAYRLVRRDLEITYKELEMCKLIGEVNFYSQREDELVEQNIMFHRYTNWLYSLFIV